MVGFAYTSVNKVQAQEQSGFDLEQVNEILLQLEVIRGSLIGLVLKSINKNTPNVTSEKSSVNSKSRIIIEPVSGSAIVTNVPTPPDPLFLSTTRRVACAGGNVTVINVPAGVTLNDNYWCKVGGGDWERILVGNNTMSTAVVFKNNLPLRTGDANGDVLSLQKSLVRIGYLSQNDVVGVYGPKTTAAVKQFQKSKGLAADGIFGVNTNSFLNSSLANKDCVSGTLVGYINTSDPLFCI